MINPNQNPPLRMILRDDATPNNMPYPNDDAPLPNSPQIPPYTDSAIVSINFALDAPSTGARATTPRALELSGTPYSSDPLGLQSTYNYAITSPRGQPVSDQVQALSGRLQSLQTGVETYASGRHVRQGSPHTVNTQPPVIRNYTLKYSEAPPFCPYLTSPEDDEVFIDPSCNNATSSMNNAHNLYTNSTQPAPIRRHNLTHNVYASNQPSCNYIGNFSLNMYLPITLIYPGIF